MHRNVLILILLSIHLTPTARGQAAEKPMQVDMLADVSTISAGQPMRLAVRFKLAAGRVVPWQPVADQGKPPALRWTLPAGFSAGDAEFPIPAIIALPDGGGDITGYEKELVLIVPITTPKDLPPNGTQLSFGVTADVTPAGKGAVAESLTAAIKVPVAKALRQSNDAAFRRWSMAVPQPPARDPTLAAVNFHLKGEKMTLKITWRQAVTQTQLFALPDEARQVVAGKSAAGEEPTETNHDLTVRDIAGKTPASPRVAMLVGYTTKDGQRRGVRLDIPVEVPKDE